MNDQFDQHKLAVIFYADIAGYSRLTARDERGTHQRVMSALDFASESIQDTGGKVLRYAGDAILAEFPSILKAVQVAIDIQTELEKRNQPLPSDEGVKLRIGLHFGEVLQDRGEIYGNGVNLAARLEAAAHPGGICVSAAVHDQIIGKLEEGFIDGGLETFKNIEVPLQVFHWLPGTNNDTRPEVSPTSLALPVKPSIAILAFTNMSNDPEQDFFAEGISEDIITELSKFRSLFVIARNSAFAFKEHATEVKEIGRKLGVRYIVEGSVRRVGQRVRITAQLIDAIEDQHLWAERYDRDLEDIFAVQDEVTQAIVTTIEPELMNTERQRARRKSTANLTAWEAYQRGLWHIYQYRREDTAMALELMHKATQLDPEFASAFAGIAYSMYVHIIMGDSDDRESDLQRGLKAGLTAVSLDDRDPFSHVGLGRLQIVRAEHEQAIASFGRALELNPSFALAHYGKGHSLWHCGHPDQSIICLDEAMRLSPRDPLMWTFLASKAIALFMLERYDEALDCSHRSQRYPVTAIWAHMAELATLGTLERQDEARGAIARALQIQPDLDMTFIRQALPVTHPASAEHFYGGLMKAGVPE
jgi:adenylate cyclase